MQKLIKLSDEHYIIVDDSEIKEGDYIFDNFCKINNIQQVRKCDFDSSHYRNGNWRKITYSTQPLEDIVIDVTADGNALMSVGFVKIKELSLSEVEEAIYGYSVENMVWNIYQK